MYDGNRDATLLTASATFAGIVNGETLGVDGGSGLFADKNAGVGKSVSISGLTLLGLGGTAASNYTLASATASTTANIDQRPLSTWTGLAQDGKWSTAGNWDALPDGSNVLAVSIPAGAGAVLYDLSGTTRLENLNSARPLTLGGETLSVAANMVASAAVRQNSGVLNGGGSVVLQNGFTQAGGSITGMSALSITSPDAVSLGGAISIAGPVSVIAPQLSQTVGASLQASGPVSLWALSGPITMAGANSFGAGLNFTSSDGNSMVNALGPVSLAGETDGSFSLVATGDVSQFGDIFVSGMLSVSAPGHSVNLDIFQNEVANLSFNAGSLKFLNSGSLGLAGSATGAMSVTTSGAASVTGPVVAGTNASITGSGVLVRSGITAQSVVLEAGAGTLAIGSANAPVTVSSLGSTVLRGSVVNISGGGGNGAFAQVVAGTTANVNATAGGVSVLGGTGTGSFARVDSTGSQSVVASGTVSVRGGTGDGAYAKLDPAIGSVLAVTGQRIELTGGSGRAAYAAIVSEGDVSLTAPEGYSLVSGSGVGAGAVVLSRAGKVVVPALSCPTCLQLPTVPTIGPDGVSQTGFFGRENDSPATNFEAPRDVAQAIVQIGQVLADFVDPPELKPKANDELVAQSETCN